MPSSTFLASPAAVRSHPAAAGLADARLVQLLRAGSAAFRRQTRQHISRVVDDTVTLDADGSTVLLLPELPVVDVSALLVDGEPYEPAGLWSERGILRRAGRFPQAYRSVQVTYTHGYDPVPEDVAEAVVDWVCVRAGSVPGMPGGQVTAGPFTRNIAAGGSTQLWSDAVRAYRRRA